MSMRKSRAVLAGIKFVQSETNIIIGEIPNECPNIYEYFEMMAFPSFPNTLSYKLQNS